MILDSSAVVGAILREPGSERLIAQMQAGPPAGIGAATVVETGMVLVSRLGISGKTLLARFLDEAEVEVRPLSAEHWTIAVDAFLRYGKGRHPADLNFGDCLVYALAKVSGQPLLCLGSDFAQTDLALVEMADERGPGTADR